MHGQRSGDHGFSLLPLSSSCYPCISPGAFGTDFCGKQDVSKGSNERDFAKRTLLIWNQLFSGIPKSLNHSLLNRLFYASLLVGLLLITPFWGFETMFFKDGTFIVCKPGSLQEISCQQTQSCVNLCHDTCGMGFFTMLQKGIHSLSLSVLGLMYDTTCDLFFFQCPFFTTTSFCLVSNQPPRHPPQKKKIRVFPRNVLASNPTNQGLGPGISGTGPHRRPPVCRLRCTCLSCSSCEEIM